MYGAYGYTGELVARRAKAQGLQVVLAGRRDDPLRTLSASLGFPFRSFGLEDASALARGLEGVRVVCNCAGPFSRTALALARACIEARVHYLDITGEIDVFEGLSRMHAEALAVGVTLLPGAGFDVVPSDCLAAHVAARVSSPRKLVLAFATSSRASRGTALTALENANAGGRIRRNGKLVRVPVAHATLAVDLGRGRRWAVAIPWGDIATAFHSTGIGNIETFMVVPAVLRFFLRSGSLTSRLMGWQPLQAFLRRRIAGGKPGPTPEERNRGWSALYAEATGADGQRACARLRGPEPYELTSWTALELARRANEGKLPAGFQTPATACGPEFIRQFPGVVREDLL